MGRYRITIEGTGTHHNTPESHARGTIDAEKALAGLVVALRAAGHSITKAEFELVSTPVDYNLPSWWAGAHVVTITPAKVPE